MALLTDVRYRLLAVGLNAKERDGLTSLLRRPSLRNVNTVEIEFEGLVEHLDRNAPYDVAVVGSGSSGHEPLLILAELRRHLPLMPIMMVLPAKPSGDAHRGIAAGTATVLWPGSVSTDAFGHALEIAVERARPHRDEAPASNKGTADRELQELDAVCGPAPMTASHRSLGSRSLRDASADAFDDAAQQLEDFLDRMLAMRAKQMSTGVSEDLQALADRLGALNAGPRDIIEVHQVALTNKLRNQPWPKAEALIEEGRLLVIQLMGYVLSYYRARTWGAARRR